MTQTNIRNLPLALPIDGDEAVPLSQLQGTDFVTARTTAQDIANTLSDGIVTNNKLSSVPAFTIKSNATSSTGTVGDNTITQVLDGMISPVQGTMIYRSLNVWRALAPGLSGQALQTLGPNNDPHWAATSGMGTVTQVNTGAGLTGGPITSSGTINSIEAVNNQSGTSYTIQASDQAKLVTFTNASPVAVSIASAATMGSGFWIDVQNNGAGTATITPSGSTIGGSVNMVLPADTGSRIASDGINYQIQGGQSPASITLTGDVTGTGAGSVPTTVGKIGGKTVTLGGSFTITGAFSTAFSVSSPTTLTLPTSGTVTALGNATTGSGAIVLAGSPTLITPTLGAALASSINGNLITTGTGTLTLGASKTLTASNTLTFLGTDGSAVNFGTGGTVVYGPNWTGNVISPTYGGTGVNNGSNTLTLAGSLATSGAFATTLTMTAPTSVTFPTSGTLVNSSVVTLSSLAQVGTITSGTWNGTIIGPTWGGTGVNNGAKTITLGGNLATSGAFASTFTMTGPTGVTFPTTGTLATLAGTESLSNKSIVGVTDGSIAAAGNIGERIGATWSSVSLTTGVTFNVTSFSLTAGDWDIYSTTQVLPNTGNMTSGLVGISDASATFQPASANGFPRAVITDGDGHAGEHILTCAWRYNTPTTVTIYALVNAVFAGTCTSSGAIWARRRR
jgi:hypothetical protein